MPAAHMVSLARELELIMAELYPQHAWIVEIGKPDDEAKPDGAAPDAAADAAEHHKAVAPITKELEWPWN
jgi:hypothetical protein